MLAWRRAYFIGLHARLNDMAQFHCLVQNLSCWLSTIKKSLNSFLVRGWEGERVRGWGGESEGESEKVREWEWEGERVREWEGERVREWESERMRGWESESERVREWEGERVGSGHETRPRSHINSGKTKLNIIHEHNRKFRGKIQKFVA